MTTQAERGPADSPQIGHESSRDARPDTPEGRATSFQAVQGEPEHYNGAVLLVTAYSALWVILLAWVALSWRRQSVLNARLGELERVIAEADARQQAQPKPKL